jgi:peptidyl-prolyl cis-trans isomerase A (cyclophilin A)
VTYERNYFMKNIFFALLFVLSLIPSGAMAAGKKDAQEKPATEKTVSAEMTLKARNAEKPAAEKKRSMDMETKIFKEIFKLEPGLYAMIRTTHGGKPFGDMVIKLFPDKAPVTVANFVELAKGEKEFTDPRSGQKMKRPYFNGLIFHRVIKNFMIQGGDPTGTGRGGPGYKFGDEFDPSLKFDKPGLLAMANAGPGTNGSQFFITVAATPWLNNKHTIFGEVIRGKDMGLDKPGTDIAKKLSEVPTGAGDRPVEPLVMDTVQIYEVQ